MADETKPTTTTSSTTPQNPLTELPREGGIVGATPGGVTASGGVAADAVGSDAAAAAAPPAPSGGIILGAGEDVAKRLGEGAPVFGQVLQSIGLAVAESQKALDEAVITGIKKLNDTKIKVVTQVVQELDEDGLPDASKTQLVTNELSVLNFFVPTFHEWKNVELSMDLSVMEFDATQGVKFHAEQESTSVGGGFSKAWIFGGSAWFGVSHSESEQKVTVDNSQDVSWSSGQVRVSALLGPRRTGKFPTPATAEIAPQIYITQGAISEQKTDDVVTSRAVDVMIEIRKRDGSQMQSGVPIVVESGGLLPDFGGTGSSTDAKGRVKVKLTRSLAGGARGFQKFPISVALKAKRQAFTVTL